MSDEAVCRTAPATPGLLNRGKFKVYNLICYYIKFTLSYIRHKIFLPVSVCSYVCNRQGTTPGFKILNKIETSGHSSYTLNCKTRRIVEI